MSRTYRRKTGDLTDRYYDFGRTVKYDEIEDFSEIESMHYPKWGYHYINNDCWTQIKYVEVIYKKNSKTGKRELAKFHKDGSKSYWRGPMWFHREYAQVPYRVRCKNEINKYYRDPDYEVVLEDKPHKQYWT